MRRLVALLLAATALASCGGEDDKGSVEDILDQAFRQEIRSADLSIEAELELEGGSSGRPLRIEAGGPFRTNEDKLPAVDLDLRIGSDGGGQTIETGFLSTGDRAFVKFQDVYYEQPAAAGAPDQPRAGPPRGGKQLAARAGPRPALLAGRGQGRGRGGGGGRGHPARLRQPRRGGADAQPQQVRAPLRRRDRRRHRPGGARAAQRRGHRAGGRGGARSDLRRLRRQGGRDHPPGVRADRVRGARGRPRGTGRAGERHADLRDRAARRERRPGDRGARQRAPAVGPDRLARRRRPGRPHRGRRWRHPGGPRRSRPAHAGSRRAEAPDETARPDAEAFRQYSECLDKARPEDTAALQECADLARSPQGPRPAPPPCAGRARGRFPSAAPARSARGRAASGRPAPRPRGRAWRP